MGKKKRDYDQVINLVPYGLPQFLDFEVSPDQVRKVSKIFVEEELPGLPDEGEKKVKLRELKTSSDGYSLVYVDDGQRYHGQDNYTINSEKNLAPFMDKWLPVPFLRESGDLYEDNLPKFRKGPTNWARAYITRVPDEKDPEVMNWRIVLAFDMQVEEQQKEKHVALTQDDVNARAKLSLADQMRDNSWFLTEGWVDAWLEKAWNEYFQDQANAKKNTGAKKRVLDYLAAYFVYLKVLQNAIRHENGGNRKVSILNLAGSQDRASDPNAADTIDVDLILDIGNSRTTGILVENRPGKQPDLNDSYLLQLRDLSRPENFYTDPFETRVEFSKAEFGSQSFSKRSGRRTNAFAWPSPVRIGVEAGRLANMGVHAGGVSGITSPKRYLWNEEKSKILWYFNRLSPFDREELVSTNPICRYLNNSGVPLSCVKDAQSTDPKDLSQLFKLTVPDWEQQEFLPANQPRFSNSSMMMFLFMEIIQQALITINSPAQRYLTKEHDYPRRLRSIIFTVPPGMPFDEQRIYRRWAYAAVDVLWEALGWKKGFYRDPVLRGKLPPQGEVSRDFRFNPEIRSRWDEATCTQLVYLFNEITYNFKGDAHMFFEVMGREREVPNEFDPRKKEKRPTLRLATIDIGGGTIDLSITTCVLANDKNSTDRILPRQEIRDGINYGGDDVLRKITQDIIFTAIARRLEELGVSPDRVDRVLHDMFAVKDDDDKNQKLRIQFLRLLAIPAAYALLQQYEATSRNDETTDLNVSFSGFMPPEEDTGPAADLIRMTVAYFNEQILERCGVAPEIEKLDINTSVKKLDDVIGKAVGPKLKNLGELIHAYDCDVLLLSGRPSSWNAVEREIFSHIPVAPDKVIPMRNYNVGDWYPFADSGGRITDPKTTVVTGAILCALAQNSMEGFAFDSSKLKLKSTAKYVGQIDQEMLSRDKVWFPNESPDKKKGEEAFLKTVEFSSPVTIGFRQLDLPRWAVTRCWRMEWASEEAQRQSAGHTPYEVKVRFKSAANDDGPENDSPLENDLLTIQDRPVLDYDESGEETVQGHWLTEGADLSPVGGRPVRIVLRTLPTDREEGCWMDTGLLYENR